MSGRSPIPRLRWLMRALRTPRRPQSLTVLALLAACAALLLWRSKGMDNYDENLALNLGTDILGVVVTVFVIGPLISRAQEGRVREHHRLDYEWFSAQVHGSTSNVKVLDTFSNLFGPQFSERLFRGVRAATAHGARVQILLLDPDSLAVILRGRELGEQSAVIRRDILRNLRTLDRFAQRLDENARQHLEVRLCSTSPGVTLYRWDERCLVSFLTVGRLSGEGVQLEVAVRSPLGTFVEQRFDELWQQGKPMERFTRLPVTLVHATDGRRQFTCHFVSVEDSLYVSGPDLVTYLARHHLDQLSAYSEALSIPGAHELIVVDDESELHARLIQHFTEKYDASATAFVELRPSVLVTE
ncbi:hypothetical protein EJ357_32550 [Streptomyces cyaneochromogenes]|uniref:Uncharacterized protein n=1 Tax=Streptomyces cyaneochromogenes TaxID=2496836 RepID=A0A3Q9ES02_9ACTN|nr:hypothetical protein [Streptomyces cyaneochromogenes]AZQ37603.1 hypothetical protein EJ357_32550 [Streptomyces cyaneochromogenes]